MKRPKSAQLLSNGMEKLNPAEFKYHKQQLHNRSMVFHDDTDRPTNSFLTDVINRGPSHLRGSSMFQCEPSKQSCSPAKRLRACKELDVANFIRGTYFTIQLLGRSSRCVPNPT